MLLKQILLIVVGFCAGGIVAAGIFAFLAMIGVFPRLIGRTGTKNHILLYETVIILGGTFGNALDLFEFSVPFVGKTALALFGGASGVYVGSLVMSLAETLKVLPIMNRRIRLAVGFQYVILGIALGKLAGSLLYFSQGMSA